MTTGADEGEVTSWIDQADPYVRTMAATISVALRTLWNEEERDGADLSALRETSRDVRTWASSHSCPDPAVADRLGVLIARFDFSILTAQTDVAAALDRLNALETEVTAFGTDLRTRRAL